MTALHEPAQPGSVVSLRARGGYRPDFSGLASGQVSAARAKLGLDRTEFAAHLGELLGWMPTAAVVKRWEQGAIPPGDVVLAAAVISQDVPGDILTLPLSQGAERRARLLSGVAPALDYVGDSSEAVTPYADRGLITRQQWNGIIQGSASHIWLYGMAEFGYASDDEVPGLLAEAAGNGCEVRVLLLSPEYPEADRIDADEGSPAGTLVARTGAALARFGQMQRACGTRMQIRIYSAHPTMSVVRGDDQMLVTPYLRYFMGSNSPTFEIWQATAHKMFGRYERHFEDTWTHAEDWTR